MKTLYISLLAVVYTGTGYLSAQCIASFSGTAPTCCPNSWQFTDTSNVSTGDSIISWYWSMPGGIPSSSTIQNAFTTYPALGFYTVCLTIVTLNGCTDSSCQAINITSLSVNERKCNPVFTISPNPISAQALIEISIPSPNATLAIYNSMGAKIIDVALTENTNTLNLFHCPNGIYFYRANLGEHLIKRGKIIKQ